MGPQTTELKKFFLNVVHGRNPKYRSWCYPIYSIVSLSLRALRERVSRSDGQGILELCGSLIRPRIY
jgi:hypothetical protein